MKISIKIIVLVVFVLPLTIQAQTIEEQLTGSWTFDDQTAFSELSAATQAHFDSIPTAQVMAMKVLYIGRTVNFNADGSFVQQLADGRSVTAQWAYDATLNAVVITHANGGVFKQKVEQLNTTSLLLLPIVDEQVTMYIDRWHFVKQ